MKRKQKRAYGGTPINLKTPEEMYNDARLKMFKREYDAEKEASKYKRISQSLTNLGMLASSVGAGGYGNILGGASSNSSMDFGNLTNAIGNSFNFDPSKVNTSMFNQNSSLPQLDANAFSSPNSLAYNSINKQAGFTYKNNNMPKFDTGGGPIKPGRKVYRKQTQQEIANGKVAIRNAYIRGTGLELDDNTDSPLGYDEDALISDGYTTYDTLAPSQRFKGRYKTKDLGGGNIAVVGTDRIFNNRSNLGILIKDIVASNPNVNVNIDPDLSFGETRKYFKSLPSNSLGINGINSTRAFGGEIIDGDPVKPPKKKIRPGTVIYRDQTDAEYKAGQASLLRASNEGTGLVFDADNALFQQDRDAKVFDSVVPYDNYKKGAAFSDHYVAIPSERRTGYMVVVPYADKNLYVKSKRNYVDNLMRDFRMNNPNANFIIDDDFSYEEALQRYPNGYQRENSKRAFGGNIGNYMNLAGDVFGAISPLFEEEQGDPYAWKNRYNEADLNSPYRFDTGGNVPIEAEGQEIVQEPTGEMYELQGPSHEQGGIDMQVPEGSQIYSKRLQGADGKTMADRKAFREKRLAKLEALVKRNPNDKILKRTLEKTQRDFAKQEQEDMEYMNYMHQTQEMQQDSMFDPQSNMLEEEDIFAYGGPIKKKVSIESPLLEERGYYAEPRYDSHIKPPVLATPTYVPGETVIRDLNPMTKEDWKNYYNSLNSEEYTSEEQEPINDNNNSKKGSFLSNVGQVAKNFINDSNLPTLGDAINLYGKYKAAYDPADMTLKNRAEDTPNINPYENYGVRGLQRMEDVKNNLRNNLDQAIQNNQLNTNAYKSQANNNARSINTMRAMNLATEAQQMAADNAAYMQYAQQVANIDSQIAQMMNHQDQMQMSGNYQRDIADRQDRDNFNKQLQQDIATRNRGIQEIGKTLNDWKERDFNFNTINQLSKDFKVNKDGTISAKGNESTWTPEKRYWNGKKQSEYDNYLKNYKTKGYFIEGDTMYDKDGKEVDPNNHYAVVPGGKEFDLSGKKKEEKELEKKKIEAFNRISGTNFNDYFDSVEDMMTSRKAYNDNEWSEEGKKYAKYQQDVLNNEERYNNFRNFTGKNGEKFKSAKSMRDYEYLNGKATEVEEKKKDISKLISGAGGKETRIGDLYEFKVTVPPTKKGGKPTQDTVDVNKELVEKYQEEFEAQNPDSDKSIFDVSDNKVIEFWNKFITGIYKDKDKEALNKVKIYFGTIGRK